MMNAEKLFQIKMGLECIGIDGNKLYRIDGNTCDDIERVCIANMNGSYSFFFGDLSMESSMPNVAPRVFYENDEVSKMLIQTVEFRRELWYYFPEPIKRPFPDVVFLGDTDETLDTFHIPDRDSWAARAWSVRRKDDSAEISVETREEHRRKGYGKQVVSAWANYQISLGKIPIYAHRTFNLESKYLAETLGAVLFADVVSYQ